MDMLFAEADTVLQLGALYSKLEFSVQRNEEIKDVAALPNLELKKLATILGNYFLRLNYDEVCFVNKWLSKYGGLMMV